MRFFCITSPAQQQSNDLLKQACDARSFEYIEVDVEGFDYSEQLIVDARDILYNTIGFGKSREIEKFFIQRGVNSFFAYSKRPYAVYSQLHLFAASGIPIPETIFHLTKDRKRLQAYVEKLSGFPVIIKRSSGGSHGVGVMKVESNDALFSVVDYLLSSTKDIFVLQQYIPAKTSARLIVLKDKVIDSIEYQAPDDDFRSNEGKKPTVAAKEFPKQYQDIAVQAVQAMDVEFGGVDILTHDNKLYVTEVNFPCFFPRAQLTTGVDIAGMMLDHLQSKTPPDDR